MEWDEAISVAKAGMGYGDDDYVANWDKLISDAKQLMRNDAVRKHKEYLESNEWKETRLIVLHIHNSTCIDCGNPAHDVHHESYERLRTPLEVADCVPLCRKCHESRHGVSKKQDLKIMIIKDHTYFETQN